MGLAIHQFDPLVRVPLVRAKGDAHGANGEAGFDIVENGPPPSRQCKGRSETADQPTIELTQRFQQTKGSSRFSLARNRSSVAKHGILPHPQWCSADQGQCLRPWGPGQQYQVMRRNREQDTLTASL